MTEPTTAPAEPLATYQITTTLIVRTDGSLSLDLDHPTSFPPALTRLILQMALDGVAEQQQRRMTAETITNFMMTVANADQPTGTTTSRLYIPR